jgi:hypothetical protein
MRVASTAKIVTVPPTLFVTAISAVVREREFSVPAMPRAPFNSSSVNCRRAASNVQVTPEFREG